MHRREFLGTAIAGTTGLLLANQLPTAVASDFDSTALVPLGKELKVSRIGFGTGMAGWNRKSTLTRLGREKAESLLRYAYDQGVRLFDMADLYGTHGYVARAMKDKPRDSYTLITKIWFHADGLLEKERPDADVYVRRFLKELQTDYIDLVQMHCQTSPKWPVEFRKQMDLLAEMKRKGMIRAHGVSIHTLEALEAVPGEPWVDVVHARVNLYQHRTDGPMEKVVPVLKKIHAAGKGIIAMKLNGEGTFDIQKRDANLHFVMGLNCIDAMIVGFEKPEHIDEFKVGVKRVLAARN